MGRGGGGRTDGRHPVSRQLAAIWPEAQISLFCSGQNCGFGSHGVNAAEANEAGTQSPLSPVFQPLGSLFPKPPVALSEQRNRGRRQKDPM